MRILLYTPHRDAHDWKRDVERALPGAQLRTWTPGDDAGADYALVWRAPREFFAPRAGLKAVFNLGAGVDAILALEREHPGLLPRDVPLVRLEDAGMTRQMVEYATHAALRYLRRFDEYALLQRERRWQVLAPHARETFVVGVLGLGALGAEVARALAALGLPVRGYSRAPKAIDGVTTFAGAAQLDAFLGGAKLLVNLLPSTAATDGILNARTFSKLAHGAYLVNLARGAHLVEADLLDALASGRVAAATLDVFATEPLPPDHPFWREPRITITPHCSADTLRAEAVGQIAAKIGALERGEPIGGIVDRDRGY
ncbi:D-isomer specific 2-hydroxyacid dehydrogenase, NAD binding domain protein [Burkholderia pseudomallei MSHR983]|uniref:2-hydroxyacid dehydrogenase n=1 Tax=Burkholderia pseudomallei TaxID=28450 RepID=UPI000537F00E|nr:glyoxylate/hydroxypyruvate reductase A [Burkholderia pseudomallei]AJX72029.1 D-isomer specific 2-hydroxyacid dehydrogenase, NAD binding domain protein [Burkholderia pseudomallei MSHR840]AJX78487.1 D-isomer specific 2-hydroxyacid dehydrogenase, NAD binding domain protein [Burkholderia pseudomallei MSHR2543]ALJ72351.1 Glyoxylate/hydroxypyruvate reductase A [Burkholderia pseudomallei]APY98540.1 glyoxylate/hydroxypyruvate reductase A [Burkholderia pseudomallei]APZ12124.1 glyoxylate/hydroxypyruv